MYKVVLPGLCDGCDFNMGCLQNGGVNCKAGHCVTKQGHVKDLGPVNEDGCLAEEKLFPNISFTCDEWCVEHNEAITVMRPLCICFTSIGHQTYGKESILDERKF